MKNMIMGVAMVLLAVIFTVFQNDYNNTQVEEFRLTQVANDAAKAYALQVSEEAEKEGCIVFDTEAGVEAGMRVVTKCLALNGTRSGQKYYKDNEITVSFIAFNECNANSELCEGLNKMQVVSGTGKSVLLSKEYEYGHLASELSGGSISLPQGKKNTFNPQINYPCVICVIDAGDVPFHLELLKGIARIKIGGIYEYKWGK